jgi:hypothetical protein
MPTRWEPVHDARDPLYTALARIWHLPDDKLIPARIGTFLDIGLAQGHGETVAGPSRTDSGNDPTTPPQDSPAPAPDQPQLPMPAHCQPRAFEELSEEQQSAVPPTSAQMNASMAAGSASRVEGCVARIGSGSIPLAAIDGASETTAVDVVEHHGEPSRDIESELDRRSRYGAR